MLQTALHTLLINTTSADSSLASTARLIMQHKISKDDLLRLKKGTSEAEQLASLQNMRADVLLVGMGMPKQELWIARNQKDLPFSVFLSGGAVFDYLSEEISRAPLWMRNRGLEWLYRFVLEPRRMFVRYIIGNPLFALRVLLSKKPFDNGL